MITALTPDEARSALLEAICAIAPETEPGSVLPDRPLREQLDLDSFDFLNVIIRLHERLGIDVPERDYGELGTLKSAVDYLVRRTAAAR